MKESKELREPQNYDNLNDKNDIIEDSTRLKLI